MADPATGIVQDVPARQRYELRVEGGLVLADYVLVGDRLIVTHTETPPALQGHGLAGQLVRGMVADARARGLKIEPRCSYVAAWFRRHPDEADVLAE